MSGFPRRRYQQPYVTCIWVAALGLVPLATGVYGAAYTGGLLSRHGAVNDGTFGFWVAWAAIGLAAGVRSALVSVVATPDQLIIRNFFTTRRIPWTEVLRIDRPRPWLDAGRWSGFFNRRNGLHVRLRDGRTRIAWAYTPGRWDHPGFADYVIEDLRWHVNRSRRRR